MYFKLNIINEHWCIYHFIYACTILMFFWLQIVGGIWADKIGGKLVLGFGVVWWSVATILTPIAARIGLPFLLVMRAFMGIGEVGSFRAHFHFFLLFWAWLHYDKNNTISYLRASSFTYLLAYWCPISNIWHVFNFHLFVMSKFAMFASVLYWMTRNLLPAVYHNEKYH